MTRAETKLGCDGADSLNGDASIDFAAQLKKSFRVLWRIAASIVGDQSLAEDVVQEAAVVALGKLDQFEPGSNFTAWMAQMVRYVALNQVRKESKHRAGSIDAGAIDRAACGSSATADGMIFRFPSASDPRNLKDVDSRITDALRDVADVARACLLLRTLDGLEYSQIAAVLGIPEGTAMSHVHRTRKALRRRLADMEQEASDRRVADA